MAHTQTESGLDLRREQIEDALEILARAKHGISAQTIILEALRAAAEQDYFWTPEWQAKERAADQAIAEGRVRTFDTVDEMLDFECCSRVRLGCVAKYNPSVTSADAAACWDGQTEAHAASAPASRSNRRNQRKAPAA